ncbi:DUF2550 domain-containing protein [Corynebacterium caspium]|uniref:DUF2550 domain-containing protein n=1 Tax=Corynebacterium caspium TaxID=234828 RepID=UPI0009FD4069|nr:DUF2550 domain-containing protein [Corynebacterium caspium]WKD59444.1 hypothetical protein CCASP_05280 [Corynebacterium caspium DSM 44850]
MRGKNSRMVMTFTAVIAIIGGLAAWRFFTVRGTGTCAVLRSLPASGKHGWRNGELRYHGDVMKYYKVRSLSPMADFSFTRQNISLSGYRDLTPTEASFLFEGARAVIFSTSDGTRWELVLAPHAELAFTTWVESAPHARQIRPDYNQLRERVKRIRSRATQR